MLSLSRLTWRYTPGGVYWCVSPENALGEGLGPRAPEVYLIAARRDQKLGLVVPEQLTTRLIVIQSTADYPLYLPAGWEVAKVRDCHFVPHGPLRLVPRKQRIVVNVVPTAGAGEPPTPPRGDFLGSTAADATPGPKGVGEQGLGRSVDLRPDGTSTG